jgi:hypothetical protein
MAQHDFSLSNQSGSSFRTDLNNCLAAIQSTNSGSSAPSSTVAFQLWADSNTGILKIRNAANDDWVGLFQLDGTLTLEDGSASSPGLSFRDDLNTGLWSSGADAVDIATGGTNRLTVNSTGLTMSACNIVLGDSGGTGDDRIVLGASSDLEIFHDGSNSQIKETGTGILAISGSEVHIQNGNKSESIAKFLGPDDNSSCEFYFNDVKHFETMSDGVQFYFNLNGGDNNKIELGNGSDLQIFHDGTDSFIKDNGTGSIITASDSWIYWKNAAADETIIKGGANSQVELYYANTKHFETASTGAITTFNSNDTSMPPDKFHEVRNTNTSASIFAMTKYSATTDSTSGGSWWYVGAERHGSGTGAQFGIWRKDNRLFYGKENGYIAVSNDFSDTSREEDTYHLIHSDRTNSCVLCIENSTTGNPYGLLIDFSGASPDNNSVYFIKAEDGGNTNRFTVWSDGDIDNHDNSYGSISDVKLKENIVDAGSQWADVKAVKVRNFNFKDDKSKELLGVVAQEIETVCPKLVVERKDIDDNFEETGTTTKSVKYSILYMKAFKALQEAMAKIETLETKVAALESA